MQFSPITPYSKPAPNSGDSRVEKTKTDTTTESSEKLTFSRMMNERLFSFYNQKGVVEEKSPEVETETEPVEEDLGKRESIRREVWRQTYSLLQEATAKLSVGFKTAAAYNKNGELNGNTFDPFGLGEYYSTHTDDWKKVQLGIVPDYFNKENTGNRILDIWLGSDTTNLSSDQIDTARKNIEKAYIEVSEMFGNKLPQLVLDTKEYVLNTLDELARQKTAA